jgi:ribonucleoside-diphosphate reductase beta chain
LVKAAEIKLYLTRQVAEEGLHSHSYQHVIEVLGLDQEEIYTLYQRDPEIAQWFDLIKEMTEAAGLAEFLFIWYALFEGTFFMAGFAAIMSLQRRGLMVGTGEQLQYIMRDEAMHVSFGLKLLSTIWQEEKELRLTQQQVEALVVKAMAGLARWASACIPAVLGYSSTLHVSHARYLVDRRLRTLGFSALYLQEEVLPWLDEQTGGLKKEKNFFESRVTEYRASSALSWDN